MLWVQALAGHGEAPAAFIFWVALWLWFTLLFANFAEAIAEGRGKAQAQALRGARRDVIAKKLAAPRARRPRSRSRRRAICASGDYVLVEAGDVVPGDGEVVEGAASVDESAVTGESAPVIRESGGDRSSVTGGTRVLSDWLVVRIASNPGESFLDRMIAMVEGAQPAQDAERDRADDPAREVHADLPARLRDAAAVFDVRGAARRATAMPVTITVLVALLVCLIPTTIGGLLSAIGIAGMDRMIQANVIAMSGRAVEAAGDVDVLLLDKTGTITLGNRHAVAFHPAPGISAGMLADAAQLASLADETPEGRSIVVLAKEKFGLREREIAGADAAFVPFTAQTRMSGVELHGRQHPQGRASTR